jgi:hypothetical protein
MAARKKVSSLASLYQPKGLPTSGSRSLSDIADVNSRSDAAQNPGKAERRRRRRARRQARRNTVPYYADQNIRS